VAGLPFKTFIPCSTWIPEQYDSLIQRRLSDLQGQFQDQAAAGAALVEGDPLLYEVYEFSRPHQPGELLSGVSVIHPGVIGDEFHMTKGHFHEVLDTAECYYCLHGEGMLVMESPEGECMVTAMRPGAFLYIPPRWAHRTVNTSLAEALVFTFVYPAHAGHDYGTIESRGFRRLVLLQDGEVCVVDNPHWISGLEP